MLLLKKISKPIPNMMACSYIAAAHGTLHEAKWPLVFLECFFEIFRMFFFLKFVGFWLLFFFFLKKPNSTNSKRKIQEHTQRK